MAEDNILQSPSRSNPLRLDRVIVRTTPTGRFRKELLPPALSLFGRELGQLSKTDHRGEARGNCCFHQSKSGKSFKVNVETGIWFCFGCNFGGDMISFVRRRYSLSFLEAAEYLGALEDGQPKPPAPQVVVKHLTLDFDIDGVPHRASVEDEPRNYAGMMRRFAREAGEQLTALGLQAESDEAETCWARLALGLDELREVEIL